MAVLLLLLNTLWWRVAVVVVALVLEVVEMVAEAVRVEFYLLQVFLLPLELLTQ
jgi:hypothetical protein